MDYNSQPWVYEVIGITHVDTRDTVACQKKEEADSYYRKFNEAGRFRTVLMTQTRLGVVKGQHEL